MRLKSFGSRYVWLFALFLFIASATVSGQALKGILLPDESVNDGKSVLYNPFLGPTFPVKIYHFNYGDSYPEGGGLPDEGDLTTTDFYVIASKNNAFTNPDLEGVGEFEILYSFADSVYGSMVSTAIDFLSIAEGAFTGSEVTLDPVTETMLQNAFINFELARYIGTFFIPRDSELWLIENGYRSYALEDILSMTGEEAAAFLDTIETSAVDSFRDWYDATVFADAYGLVSKNLAPEANAVRDYSLAVLTTPERFDESNFSEITNGLIVMIDFESESSPFTVFEVLYSGETVTDIGVTFSDKATRFGELFEEGTVDNLYEAELFNIWFVLEYMLADAYPLWYFAKSGQSALSLPQLVSDTLLPLSIVGGTVFSESDPGSSGESGSAARTAAVSAYVNSPIADTAFSLFSVFGIPGTTWKTNAGYNFTFPRNVFELGVNLNALVNYFPTKAEDYITLDAFLKGQMNFLKTSFAESHAFLTTGFTLNEYTLMANYFNTSLGFYQEFFLDPLYTNIGAILIEKYWSQFPQLETKIALACRVGVALGNMFGIRGDLIYTRSVGSFYDGKWYGYEGPNVNYLNVGAGVDMYIGDAFSLSFGLRKDFLMQNFTSLEVSLGGGFVF